MTITYAKAAAILGCRKDRVVRLIREGRLDRGNRKGMVDANSVYREADLKAKKMDNRLATSK
jgi:hypothetical protein